MSRSIQFINNIKKQLEFTTYQDKRKINYLLKLYEQNKDQLQQEKLEQDIELALMQAKEKFDQRLKNIPALNYQEHLPIYEKKDEILKLIKENQVVVIAGETGSGKTTQLPKICLEAGLGVKGFIGHTQPRRIAARSIANRIAGEFSEALGKSVGYKVRFTDTTAQSSYLKIMTDGILLAEIQHDKYLLDYDCIIIDEAHERSLNIDFLLGYLKGILKKRKDLKLIITSATIDLEKFSKHFDHAPIVEVSGRTYPVDVLYMPLYEQKEVDEFDEVYTIQDELSIKEGILTAIEKLCTISSADILVFLPTERDILEVALFLSKANLKNCTILQLYARLALADQNKIFAKSNERKIILSTNVAETSITVPNIGFVIDTGLARVSRYSPKSKVQRLPIEPISKASADQRKGRCGRISAGICVRLYSQEDFENRADFTDPEILRTNLASVILQMLYLNLGDIHSFDFVDKPTDKQINDGINVLLELEAIKLVNNQIKLTPLGKKMATIPCDPRLARMLCKAQQVNCLSELLIICSALCVQDPRERPLANREKANELHKKYDDKSSEFLSYLNLYNYIKEQETNLSKSAFKKHLSEQMLSYLRIREWFDLLRQIKTTLIQHNFKFNTQKASFDEIHEAILSGIISHIGLYDENEKNYKAPRANRYYLPKNSVFFKHPPKWVCAFSIIETTRLYARVVANISPRLIERVSAHLYKKKYSEPTFSPQKGCAIAKESIVLYGLCIVNARVCLYNKIDPILSRELLIKEGLVHSLIECDLPFYIHNQKLIKSIQELEDKRRKRDILVEDELIYSFYDRAIDKNVSSYIELKSWYKNLSSHGQKSLYMSKDDLVKDNRGIIQADLYPDFKNSNNNIYKLTYIFNTSSELDGVCVHIPIALLNDINENDFSWPIKGFLEDYITELIRSLPKNIRRSLIPAPQYAKAVYESIIENYNEGNLLTRCAKEFTRIAGCIISSEDFNLSQIDKHYFYSFIVEDNGKELIRGKNILAIKAKLNEKSKEAKSLLLSNQSTKESFKAWSFGDIQKQISKTKDNVSIKAYPALVDKKDSVAIEYFSNTILQKQAMAKGLGRLLYLSIKQPIEYLDTHLDNKAKLAMYYQSFGSVKELLEDIILGSIQTLIFKKYGLVWDEDSFELLLNYVKGNLNEQALEYALVCEKILSKSYEINKRLKSKISFEYAISYKDIKENLDELVYKGFLAQSDFDKLKQIPRYLDAILYRFDKLHIDVNKDLNNVRKIDVIKSEYKKSKSKFSKDTYPQELLDVKWLIQELRVSLFAQSIGARVQISEKRVLNELKRIEDEFLS